jgi:uncharacterized protein YndB with AHSA1/START domain
MKALKIIGIILGALVVILGIAVIMQPAQGKVEKFIVINASPATVYNDLNSFKSFREWSPWAKMDTEAQYSFEGPESGVGARMNWKGEKVGSGSQWIEESVENQKIKCGLAFEGYDGKAFAEFLLTPEGDGTKLTWTYEGSNDGIVGKAMWMVMGSMLDGQYEQGLGDLKQYIESLPAPADTTSTH